MKKSEKNKSTESAIIIGGGVSGLLSAAVLSSHFRKVIVLEKNDEQTHQRQIKAKDRHAHICVAGALEKYIKLLPEFSIALQENGFNVGDPGIDIGWSTALSSIPKVSTNTLSGYGSYKAFFRSLQQVARSKNNIEILYGTKDLKLDKANKTIDYTSDSCPNHEPYSILVVANGSFGNDNIFLLENNIAYETRVFSGDCCYHSFEIKLKEPLQTDCAFISEAHPEIKSLSFLYVPRTRTEGILTIGNFGPYLRINDVESLKETIEPWRFLIPSDFFTKISSVSKQSDFRSKEIWWHKLICHYDSSIYLVGDALLKVPPYVGLGLLVAVESLISILEKRSQSRSNNNIHFNQIFESKVREISHRLCRYEKLWGKHHHREQKKNIQNPWISLSRFFSKIISVYIFFEAQVNKSTVASRYLIKRFHLTQNMNISSLLFVLVQILIFNALKIPRRSYEKLFKAPNSLVIRNR